MEKSAKSAKRRTYDSSFRAEALRLAAQGRSTQAAAHALNVNPRTLYRWQQAQVAAEVGSEAVARDPQVRQLRVQFKRAEHLKKPAPANA